MSSLSGIQPVSGLTELFRTSALRRTAGTADSARPEEQVLLEALTGQSETGDAASASSAEPRPLEAFSTDLIAASLPAGSSLGAVVNRAVAVALGGTASQSISSLTGDVLSTDPLRVLNAQPLPGLLDSADAVSLFLRSSTGRPDALANVVSVTTPDVVLNASPGLAATVPQADESLTAAPVGSDRPDLDPRIFERAAVIPAGMTQPVSVPVEFQLPAGLVVPTLAGSGLNQVGSRQTSAQQSDAEATRQNLRRRTPAT